MRTPAPATQTMGSLEQPAATEACLPGHWLVAARVLWFAVLLLVLGLFAVNIPLYYAFLHLPAPPNGAHPEMERLSPEGLRALQGLGLSVDAYAVYHILRNTFYLLGYITVGALLFWGKPGDRLALLTSFTLLLFPFGNIYQALDLPAGQLLLVQALGFLSGSGMALIFCLFPNGHFVPRWTRWLLAGFIVNQAFGYLGGLTFRSLPPSDPLAAYATANGWFFVVLLAGLVTAQISRYRRVSTRLERQQTKWVVFGFTLTVTGMLGVFWLVNAFSELFQPGTLWYLVANTAFYLFQLLIPLSLAFAILRYRLWHIDLLINRTLVYATLTACVVGLYVLVVGYLGVMVGTGGNLFVSLLATGLVAVLFQPLRERLQRAVNHLLYGQRDEPYTVITRLSRRLEETLSPEEVLPSLVATVARALKLPYAAILLKREDTLALVASYGQPAGDPLRLPLVYQGETIGELCLAPRSAGEAFSPADRQLLAELARQAGLAAHATRLTADLQRSRSHLVTAREEERRRLRRDLHDGLGSTLTGMLFKLDATDTLLDQDPARARALLAEVRAQTQAAIQDIRRLVYGLRPPILDEWGLLAALREQVAQYELQNVQVSFEAPESLPPLPAAVEVAAYRIVLEALTNVVKHARATTCTIRLTLLPNLLTVEVEDNGVGRPPGAPAGVGLTAMRERAEELGGSCMVEDAGRHGTRVQARLPLAKE